MGKIGDIKPDILDLGQFHRRDGKIYCFRPECDGCSWKDTCQNEELLVLIGPGVNIRRSFKPAPGFLIVSIDYSQIEIRVAAQLSKEPVWLKAYRNNEDLHTTMAKLANKLGPGQEPTKAQRSAAKACNFGNLFLGTPYTLSRASNLTLPEATGAWKSWWASVPHYKKWTDSQLLVAKRDRGVSTYFGRYRNMDDLLKAWEVLDPKTKDARDKEGFIHRTAVNSPVQGTAADLMKTAMIRIHKWIQKNGLQDDIKILLTVHDEVVLEVRETPDLPERLREIERQMTLTPKGKLLPEIPGWLLPLKCDIELGPNWAQQITLEEYEIEKNPELKKQKEIEKKEAQKPKSDAVVLVITGTLTDVLTKNLQSAIYKSERGGGILVPLKVKVAGKKFRSSTLTKVNEVLLRDLVKELPGVTIEEDLLN